jgi:hypothetical protein
MNFWNPEMGYLNKQLQCTSVLWTVIAILDGIFFALTVCAYPAFRKKCCQAGAGFLSRLQTQVVIIASMF